MRLQLVRHATLIVEYAGKRLLVDPMLSPAGAMAPIENSPHPRPNPLVDLPVHPTELLQNMDGVLVTHLHRDHFDDAAAEVVEKDWPMFIQPEDEARQRERRFHNLVATKESTIWEGITISRTGAEHGKGEIGRNMAPVSGWVLQAEGEPTLYIAGDTIWCTAVSDAITRYRPEIIVVNAGAAQFLEGGPITMNEDDVVDVCQAAPGASVVAVHMEAINHCLLTRAALREHLKEIHVNSQVLIPQDGEWVDL